jgi:hypothetical protein
VTSDADPQKADPRVCVYSTFGKNEKPGAWKVWAELRSTVAVPVGGPFWMSPDGRFLVFRSGQVIRLESKLDLTPNPEAVKRMIALPPERRTPVAPMPRDKSSGSVPRVPDFKEPVFHMDCDEIRTLAGRGEK